MAPKTSKPPVTQLSNQEGGTSHARHHLHHPFHTSRFRFRFPLGGTGAHQPCGRLERLPALRRARQRRPVLRNRAGRTQLGGRYRAQPRPANPWRAVQLLNPPCSEISFTQSPTIPRFSARETHIPLTFPPHRVMNTNTPGAFKSGTQRRTPSCASSAFPNLAFASRTNPPSAPCSTTTPHESGRLPARHP